jgi:hypothetical protein
MVWKVADAVMLTAFTFSVAVQVNDPDPLAWIVIYGSAAVACVLTLLGRANWAFPAIVALLAGGWAARIAPRVVGVVPFADMLGAFEMESASIEESREMYGLLIVAAWMAVLSWRAIGARGRSLTAET